MIRAVALLLVVLATHYGYTVISDPIARRWLYYVMRGLEGVTMALLLYRPRPWPTVRAYTIGAFAASLAFIEEAQTSICGVAEWRTDVADDLCMSWLGGHALAAIASGAIAALVVMKRGDHG